MADAREYDLIVAGAGMAGIIAAARIGEMGINPRTGDRLRIALLEAGPHLLNGTIRHGYGNPRLRQVVPQVIWEELDNGPLIERWPYAPGQRLAKMVGGCSVHWGAHSNLPFDVDYENWSAMGINWSKEAMKPALDDIVQGLHFHADPEEARTPGEIRFRDAAQSLGYKVEPMLTARKNCFYCGFHNSAQCCKYDSKGTSLWYLPTALANGVELIDNAEVKKVNIEKNAAGGVVKGVFYERNGQIHEARADKVIVSGGCVGSPMLLAKSGYGPKDELGNDCIVENSNVGRNLDGNTDYRIRLYSEEPIKEAGRGTNSCIYVLLEDSNYKDGTGSVAIRTDELSSISWPHLNAMSEFAPAFGKAHKDFMRRATTRLGTLQLQLARGPLQAKGRINLRTGRLTYTGDPYIDKRLQEAKEVSFEICKKMGVQYSTRFPKTFVGVGEPSHTNGTCQAGSDRKNSVINGDFESHDVKGLFVVDASSYPRNSHNGGLFAALMGAFGARRIVATHFSRGL